jgi:hypothetical protein
MNQAERMTERGIHPEQQRLVEELRASKVIPW